MRTGTPSAMKPTHATAGRARMAAAVFVLSSSAFAAELPPPPICAVVKRDNADEFIVKPAPNRCPDLMHIDRPIEALVYCTHGDAGSSVSCIAFPEELPADPGDGIHMAGPHLAYEWAVDIDLHTYIYPASASSIASFNCIPGQRVAVSVRVVNGSASSVDSQSLTCSNPVY
jgi:hypothetical protein